MARNASKYVWTVLSISVGSAFVLGSSYVFSRIREKQEIEERLNRIEEIVEKFEKREKDKSID